MARLTVKTSVYQEAWMNDGFAMPVCVIRDTTGALVRQIIDIGGQLVGI